MAMPATYINHAASILIQAMQWDLASRLILEVWAPSKGASFISTVLEGRRIQLKEQHGWPEKMPKAGILRVSAEVMERSLNTGHTVNSKVVSPCFWGYNLNLPHLHCNPFALRFRSM